MKKNVFLKGILCLTIPLISSTIDSNAQDRLYVNKLFTQYSGQPDSIHWSNTVIDPTGKPIITGNTISPQTGTNILVSKYYSGGGIQWNKQFNGSASSVDYGVKSVVDNGNNIYTIGAMTNQSTGLDIFIAKLDEYGNTIWSNTWGSDSLDVPTDVKVDAGGNVYIAGTTKTALHNYDFVVIKYDITGALQWTYTYDYAGREDASLGLELGIGDNIMVTGASASSSVQYGIASVLLDPDDGSEVGVSRVDAPGLAAIHPSYLPDQG